MKIAHVVWGMKTGGVETMLVNIINEQVKTEWVRLFIINDFVDKFVTDKISSRCQIQRLNRKPGEKNPLKILLLNYWIWKFKPDIIHVHSYQVSKLIFGKWNIVRTIHGLNNIAEEYPRMKALYSISNIVEEFTKAQGFNSTVVMNGIKTADMKNRESHIPKNNIYEIVQVSRLYIKDKGQDILLQALAILCKRGITNYRMHFIGTGQSEEMLKKMAIDLKLSQRIVFEGLKAQDYIYQHLHEYDLFIQPSRCEGFGLTVAEAMAAKLPVLVSDIEGPMEVIGYGKYGMAFKSEDVDDLANKLEIVLKGGYDYSLIEKGYQHVCEEYDVRRTAQKYIQEYKHVLKNN